MRLNGLLELTKDLPLYEDLLTELRGGTGGGLDLPLVTAARPWLIAALHQEWQGPLLILCSNIQRVRQLQEQLQAWVSVPSSVLAFPEPDTLLYERNTSDPVARQERLMALASLAVAPAGDGLVVVASARGAMQKLMSKKDFLSAWRKLRVGDRVDMRDMLAYLVEAGYESANAVQEPGVFAHRGGIIDVFSPTLDQPVRVELFGDEIESIRYFDPATQRSQASVDKVAIGPAREVLPRALREALAKVELAEVDVADVDGMDEGMDEKDGNQFALDRQRILDGEGGDLLDLYAPYGGAASLLEYLPANDRGFEDGLIVIDDPELFWLAVKENMHQALDSRQGAVEKGALPHDFPVPYLDETELRNQVNGHNSLLRFTWGGDDRSTRDARWDRLSEAVHPLPTYGGRLKSFIDECQASQKRGGRTVVVSHQAARIAELLGERGGVETPTEELTQLPSIGSMTLLNGTIAEGFEVTSPVALTIYSDAEIFGWSKPRRRVAKKTTTPSLLLDELEVDDYVVHIEHGIGRFVGLRKMAGEGGEREYLILEYSEGDRLYVPTDQVSRVTRYIGVAGHAPVLHRLGTADWARVKERVKKAVQDVAKELLEIYSIRQVKQGYSFSKDGAWLAELEASFPYIETPDQVQVIQEVKADMEQSKPMDRLVCGDVGYGKTEVALRAAFKAVLDGKQVAVLVPTTVLAQQHYKTFQERLQAFPVRVEVLSRFRSEKEQKAVITDLATGKVDICIGTHRLIQRDVNFADLGLVIIDEEQRFGVMHKERLKQLRKEVDVLTLTATPIPRTMHMALVGVRDMSTMETPPEDRLPIRTFVREYDDSAVREAIRREMDRGGQVYFVHNRVQNIHMIAAKLRTLVPEASVVVGHGQMAEDELERVMLDFAAGKHDVLVCSTIIESGLDIPNVNTIIVNQADRLGLAQLYQLRGRVGRGANRAYAYFLFNRDKRLTEQAEKRLRTIFEATELGSGFRIAMRDLEIRGAGNLLGPEQHGQVAAVGFSLYCQLLAEAIKEYQGKPEQRAPETKIDLPAVAFIPSDYVVDDAVRLNLYQRMGAMATMDGVADLAREIIDRFGRPPQAVVNLICVLEIKHLASAVGIDSISYVDGEIVMSYSRAQPDRRLLEATLGPAVSVGHRQVRIKRERLGREWLVRLRDALEQLSPTPATAAG